MTPPPSKRLALVLEHPWLWLAPALLPFALFVLLPILRVAWLSLHDWDWFNLTWVGVRQYRRLALDPAFWRALGHTLLFALVVVPGWVGLTLVIASIIAPRPARSRNLWMTLFYMTYLISPVVLALIWSWLLAPGDSGLANRALAHLGLGPFPWLTSAGWALWSVILSTLLTVPGSGVVIYAAAIGALPLELHEAAHLEGAGPLARWWHITVPLVRPTTLYLAVVYAIASFQVFERVYIMTGGGPAGATSVLVQQVYTRAFLDFDFGAASALAMVLLALVGLVAWLQFRLLKGHSEY